MMICTYPSTYKPTQKVEGPSGKNFPGLSDNGDTLECPVSSWVTSVLSADSWQMCFGSIVRGSPYAVAYLEMKQLIKQWIPKVCKAIIFTFAFNVFTFLMTTWGGQTWLGLSSGIFSSGHIWYLMSIMTALAYPEHDIILKEYMILGMVLN